MRQSEQVRKPLERDPKRSFRHQTMVSNRKVKVTGSYQGQCVDLLAHLKPSLIDSETRWGDEGQAKAA